MATFRSRFADGTYHVEPGGCLCKNDEDRFLVSARDRYGLPIETYLCNACGLLYSTPRLDAEGLRRFYRDEYRSLYFDAKEPTEAFFARQSVNGSTVRDRVLPHLRAPEPGLSVVDLGCGAGGSLVPFRDAGWTVAGCDFDEAYLECGRTQGLSLDLGDSTSLPRGPHDLVFALHVLEHVADPLIELQNWASLLKPEGLLYVEVPGVFRAYRDYSQFVRFLHIAHRWHFTLDSLATTVQRATGLGFVAGNESVFAIFRRGTDPKATDGRSTAARVGRFLAVNESIPGKAVCAVANFGRRQARSITKRLKRP